MGDLVRAAAETLIGAAADYDAAKNELRKLLLANGADPDPARPTQAARPGAAKKRPQKQHPKAAVAAEAEATIVALLQSSPGLRTAAIARTTKSSVTTTANRLKRLEARRLIARETAGEGWRASAG
jgi:MoxR-like ATPase